MGPLTPVVGVVCGLAVEARTLRPWVERQEVMVAVTGARPGAAERACARLIRGGCTVLVSWGVAGGLDPALDPGTLVVPDEVVDETGRSWPLDRRLVPPAAGRISARTAIATGAERIRLLGVERMVLRGEEKAAYLARRGAVAMDMESHHVARAADAGGCRAIAIRAIADPARRDLPPLAAMALDEAGRPQIPIVLLGLLRRPGQIGRLLAAWRDTRHALAALDEAATTVIPAILRAVDALPD